MAFTRTKSTIERFLSHVEFADQWYDNGITRTRCMVWTGAKRTGYGRFVNEHGMLMTAHIWAYERWVRSIRRGETVDHLCHNADLNCPGGFDCPHRACVNPSHLLAGTQKANLMRGDGTAQRNRLKTECPQAHPYDAANTYVSQGRYGLQRRCRACLRDAARRRREQTTDGR